MKTSIKIAVLAGALCVLAATQAFAQNISAPPASAQEPEATHVRAGGTAAVRRDLASPAAADGARIEVTETPAVQAVMRTVDAAPARDRMMVYTVRIFLDNSQGAGAEARAIAARFAEMFPEHPPRVSYQSPYFKVAAGHFTDRTDAVALCGKAAAHFPRAFVVQEEVRLAIGDQ